jgi:hypothetical protein
MNTSSNFVRRLTVVAACVLGAYGLAQAQEDSVVYRHHSVGSSGFAALDGGTTFKSIWAMSQTEEVRRQVYASLGRALAKQFSGAGTNDLGPLFVPLFSDLVQFESVADVRGQDGKLEWTVAVRLSEPRQKAWQEAFQQILTQAKLPIPSAGKLEGYPAGQAKFSEREFSWVSAGDWLVAGLGVGRPAQLGAMVSGIKTGGRPVAALAGPWIKVNADLSRLRRSFPLLPEFIGSKLELTMAGKGEGVRTDAKLLFPEPLNWQAEEWQIPLNSIMDPVVGFSAARGIERLLRKNDEVGLLQLPAFPNQACSWSVASVPYFTFVAAPLTGVSNIMWNALPMLPTLITNHGKLSGQLLWVTNNTQIVWQGLPIMTPVVRPLFDGGREFIQAGMMPLPSHVRKPPEELFQFTKRANLAWYDWEITEERVNAWRRIYMLGLLGFLRESPMTNAPTQRLLDQLGQGRKLGNSISELTVTGPSELSFLRHSQVGLTGLEIVSILRWIDSSNFPFTWESTPFMDFKKNSALRKASRTNAVGPRQVTPMPPSRQVPSKPAPGAATGAKPSGGASSVKVPAPAPAKPVQPSAPKP